jgi:trehalose 6-phosphate synthase
MSRLICVSNRVGPLKDSAKAGGLAVGLVDALKQEGGVWFGWSGEVTDQGTFGPMKRVEEGRVVLATIDFSAEDYRDFYAGYTNRALWPIFHNRLDIADFDSRYEEAYRRVNERVAARLAPLIKPDDILWVHDYHYIPLGAELRRMGIENPIGFFLHIPFPPLEILSALPGSPALVRALFAYDLVGFQTDADRRRFVQFSTEELGAGKRGDGRLTLDGKMPFVGTFPIGIDADNFAQFALSEEARRQYHRVKRMLAGRLQIIGVDRLDYTKGLPQRLRAYERLLEDYPENRGRASFLQLAPPSRADVGAYVDIRRELERLAGHINGRFAEFDWTPIRLIARAFPRRALAGLYRASRVGLVTPLLDGMNLVAKEYVAAQDPEDPGVLVLSRFAGAAEELSHALIVNPYSPEAVAAALQSALHMSVEERKARWGALMERVRAQDAALWCRSFLGALARARTVTRPVLRPVETKEAIRPKGWSPEVISR